MQDISRDQNPSQNKIRIKPKPIAFLPGILFGGTVLSLFIMGFVFFGIITLIPALGLGLSPLLANIAIGSLIFLTLIVAMYLNAKSIIYSIEDNSIRKESGVISTSITKLSFEDVTDLHYKKGIADNIFGVGSIKFNTAGSDTKALTFQHIENSRELYDQLESTIKS